MVIEKKIIEVLRSKEVAGHRTVLIADSIVDTIDFAGCFDLNTKLEISGCVINTFLVHSCWFNRGLAIKNSVITNYVDYQMGGHNASPILIAGNIFMGFVNFFDCQFDEILELKDNLFVKGTNLLGNKSEGFANTFNKGIVAEGNLGLLDLDGVEP